MGLTFLFVKARLCPPAESSSAIRCLPRYCNTTSAFVLLSARCLRQSVSAAAPREEPSIRNHVWCIFLNRTRVNVAFLACLRASSFLYAQGGSRPPSFLPLCSQAVTLHHRQNQTSTNSNSMGLASNFTRSRTSLWSVGAAWPLDSHAPWGTFRINTTSSNTLRPTAPVHWRPLIVPHKPRTRQQAPPTHPTSAFLVDRLPFRVLLCATAQQLNNVRAHQWQTHSPYLSLYTRTTHRPAALARAPTIII